MIALAGTAVCCLFFLLKDKRVAPLRFAGQNGRNDPPPEEESPQTIEKETEAVPPPFRRRKRPSGRRTNIIGVVVPDVSNPYFSGMATAMERRSGTCPVCT